MIDGTETFDELVTALDSFTTQLTEITETTLQDIATDLQAGIITGLENAGKDLNRPGSKGLRGSIRASVRGTQLELGMNYYGYYQIFGVQGTGSVGAFGLPTSVANTFDGKKTGDVFAFRTRRHPGIKPAPQAALPIINLADLIAETIAQDI